MQFTDMTEFHLGYQFFMLRPSRAVSSFIITLACIIGIALIWASVTKMDDVVKATALLRPSEVISNIKVPSGGEVLQKNYVHDGYVHEGALLLQLDVSAETLELANSKNLMERVDNDRAVYNTLLETIRLGRNSAALNNAEASIRSERYLIEYSRLSGQIEEQKVKLERERALPDTLAVKQRLEDMLWETEQQELQFSLWKNNQTIEVMDALKSLMQNRENLERRISDLERNIRNATLYAPISGRINETRKFNLGDYLMPGEEIITIVPDNTASLKAELYIDAAYIAQITTGQKVTLRFPGLPPSKFGKLEAEITLIPADFAIGSESKPSFVVEADIKEPWLRSPAGEKVYLRSGISASGRIIISQDTVMRMILKKLDFINESYDEKALSENKK
jgi:multidrug efflux pump subunit AcrA (membrane-fusion protein)